MTAAAERAKELCDLIAPGPYMKRGEDGDYWVENRIGERVEDFNDRDRATFFAEAATLLPALLQELATSRAATDKTAIERDRYHDELLRAQAQVLKLGMELDTARAEVERLAKENAEMRVGLDLYRKVSKVAPTTCEVEAAQEDATIWERKWRSTKNAHRLGRMTDKQKADADHQLDIETGKRAVND